MKRQWIVICMVALLAVVSQSVFGAGAVKIPDFKEWTFAVGDWEFGDLGLLHGSTEGSNTNAYVSLSQTGNKLVYEWTIAYLESGSSNAPMAGMHLLSDDATADVHRGNSILIWQDRKYVVIYRTVNGSMKTLAKLEAAAAAGDTFTYRAEIQTVNKTIDVYRDGAFLGAVTVPEMNVTGEYISARTNVTVALFSDIKFIVE